jgi:hypothetical protein
MMDVDAKLMGFFKDGVVKLRARVEELERERDAYLGVLIDRAAVVGHPESCLVWLGRFADNHYGTQRFDDYPSAVAAVRKAAGLEPES